MQNANFEMHPFYSQAVLGLQAVAKHLRTSPDNLVVYIEYSAFIFSDRTRVKLIEKIPLEIPLNSHNKTIEINFLTSVIESARCPYGLAKYRILKTGDVFFRLCLLSINSYQNAIIIPKKNYRSFYRWSLERIKDKTYTEQPILPKGTLQDIYNNTIGFLQIGTKQKDLCEKYNIPFKRGVLFSGRSGCGKTCTCKWLRGLCQLKGFECKLVTLESFQKNYHNGNSSSLFSLNKPGIIFFDDMDVLVKSRKQSENAFLQTFLCNLDGISSSKGVVFVFTTNAVEDLDDAFVRPGRIDLFVKYDVPDENLRTQFIKEKFPEEILNQIDVKELVEKSNEYTFAEIEEIRKLLLLDLMSNKPVSLNSTLSLFETHRQSFIDRGTLGFGKISENKTSTIADFYDDFVLQ